MTSEIERHVTRVLIDSIHDHFSDPELDLDAGGIKLMDRDESNLYIGLFEFDRVTGDLQSEPVAVWTIEVSSNRTETRS